MRTNKDPGRPTAPRVLLMVLVLLLALPAMSAAAPGDGYGGGGTGGGGGGGEPDDTTGSIYADLVINLRDTNGAPVLKRYDVPADEDSEATTEYCVQPVSYEPVPGLTSQPNPVDGRQVWVLPLQGEWLTAPPDPLPVAEIEACDPWPQYAMYVSEVDLERLNLSRTDDRVIEQKLADVQEKLFLADVISLGSTGRIRLDDKEIDASPENQAIYESLMRTGTIPGLPDSDTTEPGPPAAIGPEQAEGANSRFDAWELAAMTIGAAASKSTPLTIDAIEYYNRIIGFPPPADPDATPPVADYVSPWLAVGGPDFVRSADPADPTIELTGSERFVDYSGFTYTRSHTFGGSVTWLDVPSLQWKVSRITDVVPFTNLSGHDEIGTQTLTGVVAFAQLADDVRALSNYVPDNTFIPGFFMDVPGADTTEDQWRAITDPAVDLGTLPTDVFQTFPFQATLSLLNPWGGTDLLTGELWGGSLIEGARLRVVVDDLDEAFTDVHVSASSVATDTDPSQDVPFSLEGGDLVGWWGPAAGFPVPPGTNVSTTFDVTVADEAPTGEYRITLQLVTVDAPDTVLASESGTILVHENVTTVLWGDPLPKLATQGGSFLLPVVVYAPATQVDPAGLTLTITGPPDDLATPDVVEALAEGDVRIYGDTGTDMVAMALALDPGGRLVGTWDAAVLPGLTDVAWYVTILDGAPVGSYAFEVALDGGNTLTAHAVSVSAPPVHGEQPGDFVIEVRPVGTPGSDAEFVFEVVEGDAAGVIFQCKLEKDGELWLEHGDEVEEEWKTCTSPKEYSGLPQGEYEFFVRGKRGEVLSPVVSHSWIVTESDPGGGDTGGGPGGDGNGGSGGGPGGDGPTDEPGGEPGARAERTSGRDRVETAVLSSQSVFVDGADVALIARADDYPDALAGAPLAQALGGPILLTPAGDLAEVVADELVRLRVERVVILGGEDALAPAVADAVRGLGVGRVDRIAGATRFDTAAKIASEVTDLTSVTHAYVAEGADADPMRGWPDALSASALAAHQGSPILLVTTEELPAATAEAIATLGISRVTVVGGPVAVSADVVDAIGASVGRVDRLAGPTRYATSSAVADAAMAAGATAARTWIATGLNYPDSIVSGPLVARQDGVLLLVDGVDLERSPEPAQWLRQHAGEYDVVRIVGGPAAVSDDVLAEITTIVE